MDVTVAIGVAASGWGILMSLAPTLQIVRVLRHDSSAGVSLGYFAVLVPGFALWVAYGVVTSDIYVALPNVISLLTTGVLIAVVLGKRRSPLRADLRRPRPR
ncbi:SemiSWEET family sugar transporter [Microbacterium sp. F51-2R]|uniref:SemiSWEET family sugar transporter n=1 Tax=Microbacterium sp. F51-2R TaxID=3445777 RepID=UPI003FA07C26